MNLLKSFRQPRNNISNLMNDWSWSELGKWSYEIFCAEQYIDGLISASLSYPGVVNFIISGCDVVPMYKTAYGLHKKNGIEERIMIYKFLIEQLLILTKSKYRCVLPICIVDNDPLPEKFPVFTFQKPTTSRAILLPDPDFFYFRGCYALCMMDAALASMMHAKAATCRPAKVSAYLS